MSTTVNEVLCTDFTCHLFLGEHLWVSIDLVQNPSWYTVYGSYLFVPGLTYKRLNRLEEALDCFLKLHAILRNSAQVMYQLAYLYPDDKKCDLLLIIMYVFSLCHMG